MDEQPKLSRVVRTPRRVELKGHRGIGEEWAALRVLAFFAALAVGLSLILPGEALGQDLPPNGALRICGADGQCVTGGGVSCPASDLVCVSGPMRTVPVEGRVEVAWDGKFGTVCDDYWTTTDADVACRDIGHAAGQRSFVRSHFGGAARDVPIWFDDVECLGSEATLAACPRSGGTGSAGSNNCSRAHTEDAGVRCLAAETALPTLEARPTNLTVVPGDTARYWLSLTKRPDREDFWAAPQASAGGAVTVSPGKVWMENDERGWSFAQWVDVTVSGGARLGESHTITHETTAYAYSGGTVTVPTVTVTVALRSSVPQLSISVNNRTIAENGGTATVTLRTPAPFQTNQTITLAVSGTATENTDYGIGSKSLTLTAGDTSVTTTITANDDTADDDDETVIVTASVGGSPIGSVTVTITDDDGPADIDVSFDTDTYTAIEGGTAATVTVTLSRAPSAAATIPLTVMEAGGADSGDYSLVPANKMLAFSTSQTSRTLTVTAVADADDDDGESLTIGFGSLPTGFAVGTTASATVNITDVDATAPRVDSIERQSPSSSPTNANSLTWRVTFSEDVAGVDQADFAVSGATATLSVSEVTASTVYDVTASAGTLADLTGTVTFTFASNHNITDTASNALANTEPTGANNNTYVVDNTRPTVTITNVPPTSNAPFTATFTFLEAVTGFAEGDITVGNGAASAFAVTDAMTYTALITPAADGAVTVDVAANVATDVAGNGNSAATRVSLILPGEALGQDLPPNGALRICGADGQCVTGGGVSCPASDLVCVSGPMRTVPVEGRVEVAWDGKFGTVCDDYWTTTDADVACRDIGHAAGQRSFVRSHFGGAARDVPIWFDDVECLGSEATLAACPRSGGTGSAGSNNCSRAHTEDAGVRCLAAETALPTLEARPTNLTVVPGDTARYWLSLTKRPDREDFWAAPQASAGGAVTVSPGKVWMENDERGWSFAQWVDVTVSGGARLGESHTITHETTAYAYSGGTVTVPTVTVTVALRSSVPQLSISVNNRTIAENGGTATVTLRTPAPFQTNQTITLAVSGTATENTDYGIGSKSLTLTAGDTSVTTTITANDDTADDDDETVIVTASVGGSPIGSVTVTITDDDGPADIDVSFDTDTYTAIEGGTAATVTVTLSRAPSAAATIPLTVMEAGGADSGDYSLVPANKMLAFSTSQTSRTLTVTAVADADDDDGESLTIGFGSLPTGFAVGTTASATVNITDVDATAPRVDSIERQSPSSSPTNANSLTWRVTFSEDVAGVDQADFAVSGATATLSVSEVTASTVYDVTASAGTLADLTGTVTFTFASNHNITDTASNALANTEPTGADNNTYVVDNTKPAVTITGVSATSTAPFTATFTFLEAVTGFAEGDITVGNGAASAFAVTDAMTYTALITPAADGAVTVDVAANVATDVVGNGNSAATRVSSTYTMPRLSISVNNENIAENGGTATVTLRTPAPFQTNQTITLAVSGTATENTDYGIGSKSLTLTAGDTSVTTTITANDDTADDDDETVIVTASVGGSPIGSVTVTITDDDGPADIDVSFDTDTYTAIEGGTAATVTVTLSRAPSAAATIPLTVMEAGGADSGDYSLVPANKMLAFSTSQTSRTLTVTAVADADDDDGESLTIGFGSLPTGFAVGTTASATVNITDVDATAPRVDSIERQSPSSSPTNANSLTWRVTFSEDVAGVDQADFAVSGATATLSVSEVTASTVYDVTASAGTLADLTGTVTFTFASNHNITDTASNALANTEPTGADNNTYVVDNTKPAVTITGVSATSTAPFTATFTFLEAVTGFAEGDITVGNGAASAFAVTDAMTYTALITPAADGAVTVDVAANVATDVVGNGNSAATRVSSTYTMPRLSISVNNENIAENGGTATVTLRTPAPFQTNQTITLAVSGTATENTDYGIGSKSLTLTAGDTSVTTTITANDDTADDDDETVIVTASVGGSPIGSVTVTITDDDGPADIDVSFDTDTYTAIEGGTAATVTVTLSRAPSAAATIPLTVMEAGGADSGDYSLVPANKMLAFSTSQTSRTLTVTAVADADDDDGESLTIGFGSLPTGFAVGTTASATVNITDVDATAPRVDSIERQSPSSSPTNANSLTWRVTFSEDVAGVDQADFAVSGATATLSVSEVTASTVYDVTASAGTLADLTGTVTFTFASNHNITDTASNALANTEPTGADNNTYVVDNTKPAVTITGVSATSTAPFTATFTFLEAVTGFAEGDITVGNGAASAFAVTDAMTYTALITPAADGAVTVDVAANVATDVVGNGNSAATRVSSTYTMPRLSISVNNENIAENGGTATVTLRTPAPFQTNQTITLAVSGTATENTDYGIGSKSLTLTAGDTSVTTTITANDDTADDDDETVIVTASVGGSPIGSVTVTITDDDGPADIDVSFDTDTYTAIEGGTAATVTVTLSRAPSAAATIPLTVMEAGGADSGDYSLVPANKMLAFSTSQTSRTLTVTAVADADDDDGESLTIGFGSLPTGFAVGTTASATVNITDVDATAPRVDSIERQSPSSSPTNANSLTWRVTFSEDVAGVDQADFAVSGATATLSVSEVTASTVYDVTASAGTLADLTGTVTFTFASNHNITDTASNALANTEPTGADNNTYVVDNTKPAVTITGVSATSTAPFTATFTFLEAVTGFAEGDITVGNGAASAFAVTDAMTYTALITPAADGAVTVDVAANVATDVVGNGNSAATRVSSTYTMPRLSISVNNENIAENGGTATVTLRTPAPFQTNQTITLAVSGTATENTDYGIGSKSLTLTAGDTSVTTTITANDDTADDDDETVIVTASVGGSPIGSVTVTITDDDGPADIDVSFDTDTYTAIEGGTAATVTVTLSRAPSAAATIPLTVMEAGGADSGDYSLVPANKMLAFSTSQTSRTLTVTAVADADDDDGESLTIGFGSLPTGFAVGTTASATVNITDVDATAPRVDSIERQSPSSSPTNANSLTWRVTFSEDVAGVDQADFAVSGATATLSVSEVTASTVYDVTASAGTLADLTGTVTFTFASNHNITDTASNALANTEPTGADNNTYVVDNTKPAVTITGVSATSTAPFTATFTFLEAVTGFAEGDITVGNGAASAFAVTDAMTYTALITPAADGAVTVDVAANVATDVVGNGNSAATRVSSTYTMPRLSISVNNENIAENGGTATVTLRTPAPFQTNQTITLAVSGTATENTDYGIGSKSLTLTAGDTSVTTTITANDDTADDDDETVIVTASVGGSPIGSVTVTITDDDGPADIDVSFDADTYTAIEGGTAATVTVTLSRAPSAAATIPLTVMEAGGADSGDYSLAPANKMLAFSTSQTSRTLTVTAVADADDDDGESLTIGFGSLPTGFAAGTTSSATVNITDNDAPNNPPVFSAATADRSVAENTAAGQDVGAAVTATDVDTGDTLAYTLGGADAASFDIVATSGQIRTRTGVTYDHEANASYSVTVTASDGKDTDAVTVTITVTDVNEPPGRPLAPSVTATAGSSASLDVSWAAPSNTGPAIASYDLQYRQGSSGNFTDGPQDETGVSAAIGSLLPNTSYEVQVRAGNAEGDGDWSPSGPGQTNNSAGAIEVSADWSLKPAALTEGDQFRLLFLSSTSRGTRDTDIAPYNTFIQNLAAAGHADIQVYSAGFRAVGCTADTDARDNTYTTYTNTAKGVPIYWLGGAKAADEYEDFYDGSWHDEANDKNESGNDGPDTSMQAGRPITGCQHDGAEKIDGGSSFALGSADIVTIGQPNSSVSGSGPLSSSSAVGVLATRPMYGLSALFQVMASRPEITIEADAAAVVEGTAAAFTLRRTGVTTAELEVAIAVTQEGETLSGTSPTSATFAAGMATVVLSMPTLDDDVDEADGAVTVTLVADTGDPAAYELGNQAAAVVAVTDDDMRGVTFSPMTLAVIEGTSNTYTVALTSAPTGTVTITPSSNNGDVTVSPETLTFTAADWSTAQPVIGGSGPGYGYG